MTCRPSNYNLAQHTFFVNYGSICTALTGRNSVQSTRNKMLCSLRNSGAMLGSWRPAATAWLLLCFSNKLSCEQLLFWDMDMNPFFGSRHIFMRFWCIMASAACHTAHVCTISGAFKQSVSRGYGSTEETQITSVMSHAVTQRIAQPQLISDMSHVSCTCALIYLYITSFSLLSANSRAVRIVVPSHVECHEDELRVLPSNSVGHKLIQRDCHGIHTVIRLPFAIYACMYEYAYIYVCLHVPRVIRAAVPACTCLEKHTHAKAKST